MKKNARTIKEIKDDLYGGLISRSDAISELRALNSVRPCETIRFEIAFLEFCSGDKNKIEKNYKKMEKFSESENPYIKNRARLVLSRFHTRNKQLDVAKSFLEGVDETACGSEKHIITAVIERELGNYESSRRNYMTALKKEKNPKTIYGLGFLECKYGHFDEAAAYVKTLEIMKENDFATKLSGVIDCMQCNYESARDKFTSLLGTFFEREAKLYLGTIYYELGDHETATSFLTELYDTDFEIEAMVRLAKLRDFEGFHEEALEMYETALKIIDEQYIYIDIAKCLCNLGRYEEAKAYINRITDDTYKEAAEVQKIYINIYEREYTEALELIEKRFVNKDIGKNFLWFYVYKKIFPNAMFEKEELGYAAKQANKYEPKHTRNHIKMHLAEDDTKIVHTVFKEDIETDNLFFQVREKVATAEKVNSHFVDMYIIECDQVVGTINEIETNYVTVVTVPETKNILTMYPVVVSEEFRKKNYQRKRIDQNI